MGVTKSGRHYAKRAFKFWRADALAHIMPQIPSFWRPIQTPCNMKLEYIAGDKRRRDMPAIIDAIFHVLERSGVVKDDCLIWVTKSSRAYDKNNGRAIVTIEHN